MNFSRPLDKYYLTTYESLARMSNRITTAWNTAISTYVQPLFLPEDSRVKWFATQVEERHKNKPKEQIVLYYLAERWWEGRTLDWIRLAPKAATTTLIRRLMKCAEDVAIFEDFGSPGNTPHPVADLLYGLKPYGIYEVIEGKVINERSWFWMGERLEELLSYYSLLRMDLALRTSGVDKFACLKASGCLTYLETFQSLVNMALHEEWHVLSVVSWTLYDLAQVHPNKVDGLFINPGELYNLWDETPHK